jgi:tripartite-type tricarboxylate transporter receptor subunit TctC
MVLTAGVVSAQDYPNKVIRIMVTSLPGGGTDFTARLVAQGITGPLGQSIIVENRPSGFLTGQLVMQAPPDGYTLMMAGSTFALGTLMQKAPYDPIKDFTPISLVSTEPNILVVHPSLPVRTVKDLIVLAKSRPGELNYVSNGLGSSGHLASELLKSMAGVNIVNVIYKGVGQSQFDLIAGEVHMRIGSLGPVVPHVKTGKLRAVAVTSSKPSALVPGVPTVAETLPGYESSSRVAMLAPAKTPAAIITRVNQETVRYLNTAEAKEKIFKSGQDIAASSPEELAVVLQNELTQMGKLIKDLGLRSETP